jgi:hypothetical protein
LFAEANPGSFDNRLCNVLKKATGVGAAVRRAKKNDSYCAVENAAEMSLAYVAATRPPQHFLDNNSSQAMRDEQYRP